MKLTGEYINKVGQRISVGIVTGGDSGTTAEITDGGDYQFSADDTVSTESGLNDSFDALIAHSATIRIQSRNYNSALYARGVKDAAVSIDRDGEALFRGWLEPSVYSQSYQEEYDEQELNCVDWIGALQYTPFRGVGDTTTWRKAMRESDTHSFLDLLTEALTAGAGKEKWALYYDGSKQLDGDISSSLFSHLGVSDMAFLGDDADSVKNYHDVVEAILQYLDLHIVQEGAAFYVFSWESLRKGDVKWTLIAGDETIGSIGWGQTTEIEDSIASGVDGQINVGEVWNKLSIKVSPKPLSELATSPLDDSGKVPAYGARQKYVTEYSSDGNGDSAHKAFKSLVLNGSYNAGDYDGFSVTDYIIRIKRSVDWQIGRAGTDYCDELSKDGTHQETIPNKEAGQIGAMLLSVGKIDKKANKKDNSPVKKPEMDDYLVVSVNGNEEDDEEKARPSTDDVRAAMPVAVYQGGTSGSVYSPSDAGMTNYLVISGNIILNPVMERSSAVSGPATGERGGHDTIKELRDFYANSSLKCTTVPSRTNKDGRFLTFKWWKSADAKAEPTEDLNPQELSSGSSEGWTPYTGDGPELYEYKYSQIGDRTDEIGKIGVLECMLRIGDKVLVENKTGAGKPTDFTWQTYKSADSCTEEEYYSQTFTIGFDPKVGDKIIGDEYEIGRNFDYNMNIDADGGMAIPLPYDAHLSGAVELKILGPVLWTWNNITRRHPTFFRHTKWSSTEIPLMAHVSSIVVREMSMKIYSDTDSDIDESDIIYTSKTDESFYNKKDEIELALCSGFTSEECRQHGITNTTGTTTVVDLRSKSALLSLHDNISGEDAKPEKLYLNAHYQESHKPRVELTLGLEDTGAVHDFGHYHYETLGKTLYVRSVERNLMEGSAQVKMGEVF